jgi:hypothetical protein
MPLDLPADERVVLPEEVLPPAVAQLRRALGRAHNVGEEDGREIAVLHRFP